MTAFGITAAVLVFGIGFVGVTGLLVASEAYWKEWAE